MKLVRIHFSRDTFNGEPYVSLLFKADFGEVEIKKDALPPHIVEQIFALVEQNIQKPTEYLQMQLKK